MRSLKRPLIAYTATALFVLLFGIVYTHFGYGVTSAYMSYAFLPSTLVAILHLICGLFPNSKAPARYTAMTLAFFVASLTVYMLVKGIFEIAGAYSHYDVMLLYTAVFFGGVSFGCYLSQYLSKNE